MSSSTGNRRQFLIAALAASGSALAGGAWWVRRERAVKWRDTARGWIVSNELSSAIRVGEVYLERIPGADGEELWNDLEDRLAPWPNEGLADSAFRGRVRAAVEDDFAKEATVNIEGFLLAETTARLCALIALSSRDAKARQRAR